MRICKCGGVAGQHELTKGRGAWSCKHCGRYEIFTTSVTQPEDHPTENFKPGISLDSGEFIPAEKLTDWSAA